MSFFHHQEKTNSWSVPMVAWRISQCTRRERESMQTQTKYSSEYEKLEDSRVGKKVFPTHEQARKFMSERGVPRRYLDSKLTDFPDLHHEYGDLMEKSFFVHGPVGSGKTHLLCALLRETSYGTSSRFLTSEELLYLIKDGYSQPPVPRWQRDEDESRSDNIISYLCDLDILALDDFGMERITEWSMSMISYIINSRYNEMRRTYISSNMDLNGLAECFNQRVASRIYQMCEVICLVGDDKRTKKGGDVGCGCSG